MENNCMNKYIIKDGNTTLIDKAKKIGFSYAKSIMNPPIVRSVKLLKGLNKIDPNLKTINTDEANRYINASNSDWKFDTIYIEHPRKNNVLIPLNEYKDFILRQMVGDIADYIQDNMRVSRLTIGIVSSFKLGLGATIPVQSINTNAKINCEIAKDYVVNYTSSKLVNKGKSTYVWIDKFPDVKSAVTHDVCEFEAIKETSVDLDVGINIPSEQLSGSFTGGKKMKFYIFYIQ